MKDPKIALSVTHAPLGRLETVFKAFEAAGGDELHFDVGDGHFAPIFGLSPAFVAMAKQCCGLPCHAHLLMERPERHVAAFVDAGCDVVTIPVEACAHQHRALQQIRNAGATPGLAVNPATPLTELTYLLKEAGRILVLARDHATHAPVYPSAYERVRILRENLRYGERGKQLDVEGGLGISETATAMQMGADRVVLDPAVFDGGIPAFLDAVRKAEHLV